MKRTRITTALAAITVLAAGMIFAKAPRGGRPPQPGGRPRPGNLARGGMMAYMRLMGQFDKNQDMQIQEDELRSGLEDLGQKAAGAYAMLLSVFDANKNGKIDPDEGRKVQEFIQIIQITRPLDTIHDWKISEDELSAAWDKLAEMAQRRNELLLKRFDKDHDGKLSAEEVAAAKERMERWRKGGRRRAPRDGQKRPRPQQ